MAKPLKQKANLWLSRRICPPISFCYFLSSDLGTAVWSRRKVLSKRTSAASNAAVSLEVASPRTILVYPLFEIRIVILVFWPSFRRCSGWTRFYGQKEKNFTAAKIVEMWIIMRRRENLAWTIQHKLSLNVSNDEEYHFHLIPHWTLSGRKNRWLKESCFITCYDG